MNNCIGSVILTASDLSVETRTWREEPDGPNDRPVDIYFNGNWVPAFFSDLRKGDFFLDVKMGTEPDKCFLATSGIQRSVWRGVPSFVIRGLEVVQAPAIKDINTSLPLVNKVQLPNNKKD